METAGLSRNAMIGELTKSPHGKYEEYLPVGREAAKQDPEFFAHLVAWNQRKGQVRDAKAALPVVALVGSGGHPLLVENALAHIALQGPRELSRATRFAKSIGAHSVKLRKLVEAYLRLREGQGFDRVAARHSAALIDLYCFHHIKPSDRAQEILFTKRNKSGMPAEIAALRTMSAEEAAGAILTGKLPFPLLPAVLGKKMEDPAVALALIKTMTPNELVSHAKMLKRLGVQTNPALRGAFEEALERAGKKGLKGGAGLKAAVAAKALAEDDEEPSPIVAKLNALQERRFDQSAGVEGDWLLIVDVSSSMQEAIAAARPIAATLARSVKGRVHVTFCNSSCRYYEATGKTLEQISAETALVTAGGSTSIGIGAAYMGQRGDNLDGIAIVSDGAENTIPAFTTAYQALTRSLDKAVPVYLYWLKCHQPTTAYGGNYPEALSTRCAQTGIQLDIFDLRKGVDFYSLPNLVQTMRTNRYSLVDEVFSTPLLTLADVFPKGT